MKTKLILRPGQKGTHAMIRKYGERLLAVRYRYDEARRRRFKTVELLEAELPWDPPCAYAPDQQVHLRVAYGEVELRRQLRSAGARWRPEVRAWELDFGSVQRLGLEARVIAAVKASTAISLMEEQ